MDTTNRYFVWNGMMTAPCQRGLRAFPTDAIARGGLTVGGRGSGEDRLDPSRDNGHIVARPRVREDQRAHRYLHSDSRRCRRGPVARRAPRPVAAGPRPLLGAADR